MEIPVGYGFLVYLNSKARRYNDLSCTSIDSRRSRDRDLSSVIIAAINHAGKLQRRLLVIESITCPMNKGNILGEIRRTNILYQCVAR